MNDFDRAMIKFIFVLFTCILIAILAHATMSLFINKQMLDAGYELRPVVKEMRMDWVKVK